MRPRSLLAVLLVLAAACNGEQDPQVGVDEPPVLEEIGEGEGALRLIALAGYVEDGSSDPDVDWVTPFEERTGCQVEVRYADSATEMLGLMRRAGAQTYDGLSAPGDVAGELIAGGEVQAVDPRMFSSWRQVLEPLRSDAARHYVVDGRVYVNDIALHDDYVPAEFRSHDDWGPTVVDQGYYFVMGDHRNNSSDSRHWGSVPKKYIVGKVKVRWWPIQDARIF